MKKLLLIIIFATTFCGAFSQEAVHATFLGKSYNGTAIPDFNEEFRSLVQVGKHKFRKRLNEKHRQIPINVTHLTVKGEIILSTIWFMRDSLPNLTHLDLSRAKFIPDINHARIIKNGARYMFSYPLWFDGKNTLCTLCDAFFTYYGIRRSHNHRNLQRVILPKTLNKIGQNAFRGTPIDSIVMPHNIRYIGPRAFMDCINLRYITLPDGLETIGEQAFSGSGLTRIEIPKSVKRMGLFRNTPNLREISVHWQDPSSVEILEILEGNFLTLSEAMPWLSEEELEIFLKSIPISEVKLIVPRGTKERYLALRPWKYFNIVERRRINIFNRIRNR